MRINAQHLPYLLDQVATLLATTHCTVWVNFGTFHRDGDAVQENDDQDNMVKHLVTDDFIAYQTEPREKRKRKHRERFPVTHTLYIGTAFPFSKTDAHNNPLSVPHEAGTPTVTSRKLS